MKLELNLSELTIVQASPADAQEILSLQKLAYESEARLYEDWSIPPLTQTLESLRDEIANSAVLKAELAGRLVGSVRAQRTNETCYINRLIVHPEFQQRGIGSRLLAAIEGMHADASRFELFTGSRSAGNIRLYQRHGYAIAHTRDLSPQVSLVFMHKSGARDTASG